MSQYTRKIRITLYDDLGLSPNASPIEIRERFILLAKATHPDFSGELADLNRFKRILAANYVLRDYWRRRRYDEYLASCVDFNPFVSELVDTQTRSSTETSGKQDSEPSTTGYRFSFGSKRKNESAETRNEADKPQPSGEIDSTAEKYRPNQSDNEQPVDSPFNDTHEREIDSQRQQDPFGAWSASRTAASRVKRRKRLPWAAIAAQVFAIVFGAICAGVIAHFVLLWLRPESGGLQGIFM